MRGLLLLIILLSHCDYIPTKSSKKRTCEFASMVLFFSQKSVGDFYSQIFYLNPLFLSEKNYNFFERVSVTNTFSNKKKLILVHGWQPKDKDSNPIPTEQDLKSRLVEDIWKEVFDTNFFPTLIAKDYDIYFYTYLSSNPIASNGSRFRSILETFFSNSSNIYILAHSMGGLVVRDALYKNETSLPIQEIFAVGTPFHGSPWASSEFQENKTVIGDYASFITESLGGKDLAWDNFDSSLSGAQNPYLEKMNSMTEKDFLITAYYGELDKNSTGYLGSFSWLNLACNELGNKFSPSDCIVPIKSARGDGLNFKNRFSLGNYNHLDINLKVYSIQSYFITQLP